MAFLLSSPPIPPSPQKNYSVERKQKETKVTQVWLQEGSYRNWAARVLLGWESLSGGEKWQMRTGLFTNPQTLAVIQI